MWLYIGCRGMRGYMGVIWACFELFLEDIRPNGESNGIQDGD